MATYFDLVEAVADYYGSGSDQWLEIAKYGITAENAESILQQVPNVNLIKNADGSIRSWTYTAVKQVDLPSNIGSIADSNLQLPVTSPSNKVPISIPANTTLVDGKVSAVSGIKSAGKFVMNTVAPAVAAASVGIKLGKFIDSTLYNINPDFWDEHGMSSLNPETWSSITSGDDSTGANLFNMVFGIDSDNNATQGYLDETAFAYMAMYMQQMGAFNDDTSYKFDSDKIDTLKIDLYIDGKAYPQTVATEMLQQEWKLLKGPFVIGPVLNGGTYKRMYTITSNAKYAVCQTWGDPSVNPTVSEIVMYSDSPSVEVGYRSYEEDGYVKDAITKSSAKADKYVVTYNGKSVTYEGYFAYTQDYSFKKMTPLASLFYEYAPKPYYKNWNSTIAVVIAMAMKDLGITNTNGLTGVTTQPEATTPDLSDATTVDEVLAKLKETYPELWENAVTNEVVQPDGTIKEYVYVPVGVPDDTTNTPTTSQPQSQTQVSPDTSTNQLLQSILDMMTPTVPPDTNPPTTGDGDTPAVIVPTGSANALYSVYNPSQTELNSLGQWLWSNNFVDQLLKMFNDPMQAIIGLHKVYAKPSISGRGNIKVGYLDSGIDTNLVASQYITIDCGSVDIHEYFGNVLDYDPYTKISIYLPFIGIVPLNPADVLRSTVSVNYHVDVLTGACLAEVSVLRDAHGGVLYTYTGNCAVQYPLSSGSYMGIVGGILGIAGSVIGTVMTGGALAPTIAMAGASATHMRTSVSQSGSLSGNAGAMGIKTPYLIITRPQTAYADNFETLDGYPANYYTKLSSCTGYVKVHSVHVDNIPATDSELKEIEKLLKDGIIVS